MSLRQKTKQPTHSLVLFDVDQKYCIIPSKKISEVISGSRNIIGSIVSVQYGAATYSAKIIALHGKYRGISLVFPQPTDY